MARVRLGDNGGPPLDDDESLYPAVPKITSGSLDFALFNEYLSYNAASGLLVWKKASNKRLARGGVGQIAGTRGGHYCHVWLKSKNYLAHRVAWLLSTGDWPRGGLDHIDGDGRNNKLSNLREATHAQNMQNKKLYGNNTSGARGVSIEKGKFRVRLSIKGRNISGGTFSTLKEATAVRRAAARKLYGAFAPVLHRVRQPSNGVGQ